MRLPVHPRVIVTGAASGLGKAFCEVLAERKARIVMSDVNEQGLGEPAEHLRAAGGTAHPMACDVRRPEDVERMFALADTAFGGVDLVVNNAGVAVGGPIGDVALDDWKWVVDVNLWGVIYGCHFAAQRMKAAGGGNIINVASAAGLVSMPDAGPYNVTKAGVVALSETLFAELRPHGVHVTVLCPTFFPTQIVASARFAQPDLKTSAQKVMSRSRVKAADVARAAIASAEASDLYSVPMLDGRTLWRLKRADPERFQATLVRAKPWITRWAEK